MRILKTFCLAVGLLLSLQVLNAQDNCILHTVLKGQGLYSISRMYGVTEQDIIALNPGSDEVIKVGQQLRIPVKQGTTTTAEGTAVESRDGYIAHLVQAGETMYRLTVIYGVSGMDIRAANPKLTSDNLKAGEIVYIPVKKAETTTAAPQQEDNVSEEETTATRSVSLKQLVRAMKGEEADADDDALRVGSYKVKSAYDPDKKTKKNTSTVAAKSEQTVCKEEHKVRLLETVYSISRRYGITQEALLAANPEVAANGLKFGRVICIPYTAEEQEKMAAEQTAPNDAVEVVVDDAPSTEEPTDILTPWNGINVAVILPFQLEASTANADKAKMVEYYEGLLLAVDSLKHKGVSVCLYAYDSGTATESIQSILEKEEMATMDIIFGPVYSKHIDEAATFAAQHEIPLVLPFARNVTQLDTNPMIYQVNCTQDDLDNEALDHFFTAFTKPNVLFFEAKDGDPSAFARKLMTELDAREFSYQRLPADTTSFVTGLMTHIDKDADNILMLASDDKDHKQLLNMMPVFQLMARDSLARDSLANGSLQLFGYPQYQAYAVSHMEECQEVNTWFYSAFYTNNLQPESADFQRLFQRTYSRDLVNRYPKYGILGFDTAWYFLRALSLHPAQSSTATLADLDQYDCATIQTGFRFERVSETGGWTNRKVYLIHIGADGRAARVDYD